MTIAQLDVLLTASAQPVTAAIALADAELTGFSKKLYAGPIIAMPSIGLAMTELTALQAKLAAVGAQTPVINVNTTQASAALTALEAQLAAIKAQAATPIPVPVVSPGGAGMPRVGTSSGSALQQAGMRNLAGGAIASTVFTAPLALGGAASLKFAGDFQKSMLQVAALTDVGKGAIAGLSREVLQLSADPNIKASPTALADALYYVASTGLKGADAMKVLKASALGMSAGLGDAKVIANTLTSVRDAYGQDAGEAGKNVDILTQAVKFGKGEANEYASALAKVIPIASQAGVSFAEVAAQMASATRVGLKPSETATALRQIFNNLIDPSEKSKKAMKELGTSVEELRLKLRGQGLFATLKELSERTGGRVGPITELFGNIRALTGFLATTGEGTLKEYQRTLDAINHADGSTLDAAKTSAEGFNFQMEKLVASLQKAAIEIGDRLIPRVTEFVSTTTKGVPAAMRAWDTLPDGMKKATLAIGGMLALSGPLTAFVGLLQVLGGLGLKLAAFAGIGGGASAAGGAAAGIAGGPVAWALIAAGIIAAGAAYLGLKGHIESAAKAEELLQQNAKNTQQAFDDALGSAQNPKARRAIDDLQAAVEKAGEKADGLDAALKKAIETRREIKELGLAPNAAAPLLSAIDKIIAGIENKQIHLGLSSNPFGLSPEKQAQSNATWGQLTPEERALNDKARKYGLALPEKPAKASSTAIDNFGNEDDYQYRLAKFQAAVDQIRKTIAQAEKDATHAAQKAYNASFQGEIENTLAHSPNNQRKLLALQNKFNQRYPNPELAPQKEADAIGHVNAQIEKNTAIISQNAATKKRLADDARADAEGKQKEADAATQDRILKAQQKTLGETAQMWNQFASQVEGVLGRIRQVEEVGGVMGEKTAKARVEAELLKRVYSEIPDPLKQSLVALAGIEYRMQKMLGLRDGLRDLFNGIFAGLSAGGREQFAKFATQFENQLGQGSTFAGLQAQRNRLAIPLITESERQISANRSAQEQLSASRSKPGEVYGEAVNAKSLFEKYNLQSKVDMTCADVASRTVDSLGFHIKKSVNARQLEKNARDAGWEVVDPRTAPAGSLVFKYSASARSKTHAMMSLGGGHLASSSNHKTDYFDASGNERAYAPPGGNVPVVTPNSPQALTPAIQVRSDRKVTLPGNVPFDSRLLTLKDLPKSWGGMMQDYRAKPGESTDNRREFERFLQTQIANGAKFSDTALGFGRQKMTEFDLDATIQNVTKSARDSIRNMGAQIRMVGKENNPLTVLMESFKSGENQFLSSGAKNSLIQMTTGLMVETTRQATREMRRAAQANILTDRATTGLLGAGFEQGAYDRARFSESKRREIWNSQDITNLLQAGKAIEASRQAAIRLKMALDEFDSGRAHGALLGFAQNTQAQIESNSLLQYQLDLLKEGKKNQAEINDLVEVERTRREALKALEPSILKFDTSAPFGSIIKSVLDQRKLGMIGRSEAEGKASDAGAGKGKELEGQATAGAIAEQKNATAQAKSSLANLQAQLENARKYGVGDPALDMQNQLDQKRRELEDANKEKKSADRLSPEEINKRVAALKSQLEVEQQLKKVTDGKTAIVEAQNSALDAQAQREMALVYTAQQRLDIELRAEAAKRRLAEARGVVESEAQKKARESVEAQKKADAAQQDRLGGLRSQAGDVKDSIRSLMSGDFGSIGQKIRDQILDQGATTLTNMLFKGKAGGDVLDPRGGGLLQLLGIGGFAGPLPRGSVYDAMPKPSQFEAAGGSIVSGITSALQSGISAATVTVNGANVAVRGVNVNVAGGGTGAGIGSIIGFGGGAGSGPSTDQVFSGGDGSAGAILA